MACAGDRAVKLSLLIVVVIKNLIPVHEARGLSRTHHLAQVVTGGQGSLDEIQGKIDGEKDNDCYPTDDG